MARQTNGRTRAVIGLLIAVGVPLALVAAGRPARAAVLLAKDEALALAFPDAERVEERTFILTDAQTQDVERRARAKLETQIWTIYVGWKGSEVQGYAIIDTHNVRTLPETFMAVIERNGSLRRVDVLAFHEPPEYMPTERWVGQFPGRKLDDDLKLGAGIQGITGATLSAQAMTAGARRALALVAVLIQPAAEEGK